MAYERIERLLEQGYDKSQIVARLTGTRDNSGGADQLSAGQLRAIGFGEGFIQNALGSSYSAPKTTSNYSYDWRTGQVTSGGNVVTDYNTWYERETGSYSGGGSTGGSTGGGGGGVSTDENQSAYRLFANMLALWGIPVGADIATIIQQAVVEGITPDMIDLIIPDIQNTDTWKQRFPGWHQRTAAGYPQITVGEYLALESAYHRTMQAAGLPSGFYDDPSDFGNWIANNVSPDELQDRVNGAMDLVRQVDPTARGLLAQFYGVDSGGIAAYFLDPQRALPTLARQYEAVNVAAWAARYGLNLMNSAHWEDLVDKGVTKEMAAQGYGTVKRFYDVLGNLGDIHGIRYGQSDAEQDVFFQNEAKRRQIVASEVAAFAGSSGFQQTGLSRRGSTAGSY